MQLSRNSKISFAAFVVFDLLLAYWLITLFQARDEVELLMRRDRAGCWITMDEVLFFETCAFEIWCEKERWASGRVVRTVEMDDGVESGRRGTVERTNEEDETDKKVFRSSSNENESDGDGESNEFHL